MSPAHAQYGQYGASALPHTGINLWIVLAISLGLMAYGALALGLGKWLRR